LGVAAINMHRATPDGGQVEWRIAGMEGALGAQRLPFFIDWGERAAELDAEHAAAAPDGGITTVEVGGDPDTLRDWVGEALPEIVPVGGEPGVPAIHIRRGLDGLVLRAR
jgi:hypothetical protein